MSGFLAIDPGINCVAYAWFENGAIRDVGLSRVPKRLTLTEKARQHRDNLDLYMGCRVVVERMWYRGVRNSKGTPQDLMDLNLIAGHLGTEWLTPQEWKGSIPKKIHHKRILSKLTEHELFLVNEVKPASLRHNAIDAVGIALVVSKRMKGGSL